MSPDEAAVTTIVVICAAVIAAYRTLCWLLDRHIRARREEHLELDRWQQTTRQAARDEGTVADDVATRKAAHKQGEAAADMATRLAIWDITPHNIPHQTRGPRRTEEDK